MACFGLQKIQDPPHFQFPRPKRDFAVLLPPSPNQDIHKTPMKELLLTVHLKFLSRPDPKRDSSVSITLSPYSRLDAKGPIPWSKTQNLVPEEHMAKWQNPLLWRKQELQKQKQKKVTPIPLSRLPERTRKSPKTWCYQRKRSWSSIATEEEGEKSLDFVKIASYRGKQVKRRPRVWDSLLQRKPW